jgi:phosphoribosylformylglycinamidine (FGAM) synthase PurS component
LIFGGKMGKFSKLALEANEREIPASQSKEICSLRLAAGTS